MQETFVKRCYKKYLCPEIFQKTFFLSTSEVNQFRNIKTALGSCYFFQYYSIKINTFVGISYCFLLSNVFILLSWCIHLQMTLNIWQRNNINIFYFYFDRELIFWPKLILQNNSKNISGTLFTCALSSYSIGIYPK